MDIRIKTNFQFLVSSIQYAPNGELCITLMSDTATEEKHFEYTANLGSGQAEERPQTSLAEYVRRYVGSSNIKEKTKSSYHLMLKHLLRYGDRTLEEVTTGYLQGFIGYLEATGMAQNTVRLYFQKMTCVLHNASKEGLFDDRILQRVQRVKRPKDKKSFLTEAELNRLIRARRYGKHSNIESMFLFSCMTGLRFGDVKALKWKDVRHDGKHLRLEFLQHKTGTCESLPLCEGAEALLRGLKRKGDYVFEPVTNQWTNKVLKTWMRDARIRKPATFHTARHTFCVMLLTKEVPIFTVQKLMCHSDIGTTKVYADILNRTKDKAVRKLPYFDVRKQAV